jgi:hypothetical protein
MKKDIYQAIPKGSAKASRTRHATANFGEELTLKIVGWFEGRNPTLPWEQVKIVRTNVLVKAYY